MFEFCIRTSPASLNKYKISVLEKKESINTYFNTDFVLETCCSKLLLVQKHILKRLSYYYYHLVIIIIMLLLFCYKDYLNYLKLSDFHSYFKIFKIYMKNKINVKCN